MNRRRPWGTLSLVTMVVGILAWAPNLLFASARTFWAITLILNPIGVLFGLIALRQGERHALIGIIGNAVMSLSLFWVMLLGYLIAFLTGGRP